MEIDTLEQLIEFCKINDRVCPQPQLWNSLWDKLKNKKRIGSAGWQPSLPLILAAWWEASPSSKQQRLIEHLIWADNQGQIKEITEYLIGLTEDQWFHNND